MKTLSDIDQMLSRVMHDPTASSFVKRCIQESLNRDCVDVVNDLEWLNSIFSDRLNVMLKEAACNGTK